MSRRLQNPVLIATNAYRKAVVRHATEQIREIEGRLTLASGSRFEAQLHACDDLAGVARLLLALQRRTELKCTADNGWLEELSQLSPADVDERAIELVRPEPTPTLSPKRELSRHPHPPRRTDAAREGAPRSAASMRAVPDAAVGAARRGGAPRL